METWGGRGCPGHEGKARCESLERPRELPAPFERESISEQNRGAAASGAPRRDHPARHPVSREPELPRPPAPDDALDRPGALHTVALFRCEPPRFEIFHSTPTAPRARRLGAASLGREFGGSGLGGGLFGMGPGGARPPARRSRSCLRGDLDHPRHRGSGAAGDCGGASGCGQSGGAQLHHAPWIGGRPLAAPAGAWSPAGLSRLCRRGRPAKAWAAPRFLSPRSRAGTPSRSRTASASVHRQLSLRSFP